MEQGADGGIGSSKSAERAYLLSHKFVLETNDVAETPRSIVAVQLLGPFSARCHSLLLLPLCLNAGPAALLPDLQNRTLHNLVECL